MANKLYSLGDSWAWGWAGSDYVNKCAKEPYKNCYAQILADRLHKQLVNLALPANSFPQITQQFFRRIAPELEPGDVVLLTVPPDMRWHKAVPTDFHVTGVENRYPWSLLDSEDTISMLFDRGEAQYLTNFNLEMMGQLESELAQNNYNPYWFKYNTSLQLIALSAYSKLNNINLFVQHNYGTLDDLLAVTDTDCVLDVHHSMWEWIGLPPLKNMLDITQVIADGPRQEAMTVDMWEIRELMRDTLIPDGESFDWHPNENSHRIIGEKLYELCNQRMG